MNRRDRKSQHLLIKPSNTWSIPLIWNPSAASSHVTYLTLDFVLTVISFSLLFHIYKNYYGTHKGWINIEQKCQNVLLHPVRFCSTEASVYSDPQDTSHWLNAWEKTDSSVTDDRTATTDDNASKSLPHRISTYGWQTEMDRWASGSNFRAQCHNEVVCPN